MAKKVKPAVWVDSPANKSMHARSCREVLEIICSLEYILYMIEHTNKPAFWNLILYRVSDCVHSWIRKIAYDPLYLGLPLDARSVATPYSELPPPHTDEDDLLF